jgi:hypothetical protein
MKVLLTCLLFFMGSFFLSIAEAYNLSCDSSDSCKVTCDNGQHAGTMYWNGTQWSDGLRSNTDKHQLARQMVAAQGTACK